MKRSETVAASLLKEKRSKIGRTSKNKGSEFERRTGQMLSVWITGGERDDLFSRNVLSGGRFTNAAKTDSHGSRGGISGDLMPAHPLAFEFLSMFMIECKHYKELGLHQYLMDEKDKSFLGSVIKETAEQAAKAQVSWLLIARQNRMPTLLFMPRQAYLAAFTDGAGNAQRIEGRHHLLHNGAIGMLCFEHFLLSIEADRYFAALRALKAKGIEL